MMQNGSEKRVSIAVIGGSGLYHLDDGAFPVVEEIYPETVRWCRRH
jgi:purine nucleoside phosphorylase